jgi:hypothetical protein
MWMISWYDDRKVCTVVTHESHTLFSMACMLDAKKTKFKVTDRLGLIDPKKMGWGDFDFWLTGVDDPLY